MSVSGYTWGSEKGKLSSFILTFACRVHKQWRKVKLKWILHLNLKPYLVILQDESLTKLRFCMKEWTSWNCLKHHLREDEIKSTLEAIMARFLNGLRPDIVETLELQPYVEISEMVDKTIKIEQSLKRRGQLPSNYAFYTPTPMPNQPRSEHKQSNNSITSRPKWESSKGDTKIASKVSSE